MICDRIKELIPECLAGRLDAQAREKVIDHLDACSSCRADFAEMGVVWRGLESMPELEPSENMRVRFLETLKAYEEGYQEAQRRQVYTAPAKSWWAGWLPARPAWQMAFSAALVLAGLLGGRYLLGPQQPSGNPEMAQLRGQVESLRQLITLSMLQQDSPSARLRGVTYSYQIAKPDNQVEQALLQAMNHDSNVAVRLSAVDALAKFGNSMDVRRALVDSLAVQDSPLVQVALIDLLVQLKEKEAVAALRTLSKDAQADETVRQRAADGAQKLEALK
jgi:hypothetical protein